MTEPVDLYYFSGLANVGGKTKSANIGLLLLLIIDQRQYSMGNLLYLLLTFPKYCPPIGSREDEGVNAGKVSIKFVTEVFT